MWNLPPPPNFQGLDPHKPLRIYQRHLPHWRQEGATYFATFRLADSLPQAKLHELERIREEFYHKHPPPLTDEQLEELARDTGTHLENWLDEGYGACHLKQREYADHVIHTLHYFDTQSTHNSLVRNSPNPSINTAPSFDQTVATDFASSNATDAVVPRYELDCYVVMANHVHAIVRPLDDTLYSLEDIVGSWKQYSATKINRSLGLSGALWRDESFDRLIRDEEHLWRSIQYIGKNPVKAGLPKEACPLWIRPEWEALGWTFES